MSDKFSFHSTCPNCKDTFQVEIPQWLINREFNDPYNQGKKMLIEMIQEGRFPQYQVVPKNPEMTAKEFCEKALRLIKEMP